MNMKETTEKQLELPGMNTGFYKYFQRDEINLPVSSDPQITKLKIQIFLRKGTKINLT